MKLTKNQFFKRQITLSEIGEIGQQKLQNATVLVVGCGGLGGPVAVYLAASGIGKIHLVDFDTVDITNLHRQVFFTLDDVGQSKAEVLSVFIKKRAPFTAVTFTNKSITKDNVFELINDVDIVVDGTDSLPTKYLLNDACVIKNKTLVYGSLYKFDGYVAIFNVLQKDNTYSANLRDAFPEMATDIPNCEEAGTLNAIVGMMATQQVNEVLKLITGVGEPLTNQLRIYNTLQNKELKMKLRPTVLKDKIAKMFQIQTYVDAACSGQNLDWQISAKDLKAKLGDDNSKNLEIIAVLNDLKLPFKVQQTIHISKFDATKIKVDFNKTYIMVCQRGFNSYKATEKLKEKYPALKVLNLTGGISSYK
ncbi:MULTISPECIES: HesA/MoeB/ThiF family protein [unclassified Polaribacter]|uniref:HesA/MoeB/ThiF family protein n=1 Tax=unclassified Polaribacter TaxID=196858 RepID=UPI0011BF11CA|nr:MULTISPECIES: HesA/MoeB/ThiF family protein [unclassified Polaribacter]TXD51587.1 molybdopterin biosynthesis protein MoeB [Polaribacter sp. IC063]TXD61951.1 molybdopterin biosynthesis protein MoeB [Polaribacter sp. IC066]